MFQINGMVIYSTVIGADGKITFPKIRDRAYVYQNKRRLALIKGSVASTTLW